MITKERLQELIEQKAKIYSTHWEEEVDLSLPCEIVDMVIDGVLREYLRVDEGMGFNPNYLLSGLTEDIEGAKWEEEFGCIERTERFEPLYYENIDQNYCYEYRFSTKNNHEYMIRVSNKDIILFWTNCNYKEYFKNTKEEYEKLIRRCKKMFLEGDYAN